LETVPAPGGAGLLAEQGRIAEGAEGGEAGVFRGHAGCNILLSLPLDMETQLLIEQSTGTCASKQHLCSHHQSIKPHPQSLLGAGIRESAPTPYSLVPSPCFSFPAFFTLRLHPG